MTVAIVALSLIAVGVACFLYGTIKLSQYAFRISTGRGLAVLLFPPYTIYFAVNTLDEPGKELPTSAWVFGVMCAAFTAAVFWSSVELAFQGRFDRLSQRAEAATSVETDDGGGDEDGFEGSDEKQGDDGSESSSDGEESEQADSDETGEGDSSDDESGESAKEESSDGKSDESDGSESSNDDQSESDDE